MRLKSQLYHDGYITSTRLVCVLTILSGPEWPSEWWRPANTHTHTHTHAHTHTHTQTHTHTLRSLSTRLEGRISENVCVCYYVCVCACVVMSLSLSLSLCVCVCVCFYVYIRMCVCGYVSLSLTLCGYVCVLPDGCSQDDGNTHSHRQSVFTRRSSFLRVQSKPDKRDTSVIKPQDHTSPPVQNLL